MERAQIWDFFPSDLDLVQMTFYQGQYTPLGHKQYSRKVRSSNIFP